MTLVTTIAPLSDHVVRLKFLSVGNQANIATGAWVVVRDDGKELILKNSGSPAALKLDTKEVHEHANAPTHQQGTNQPGRCINRSATHAPRSSRPIGTMKRSAFSSILWPAGSTWRSRRENSDLIIFGAPRSARSACCQETGSLGLRQRAGRNAMELVSMHQYLQPAGRVVTATIGVSHAALRPSV